LKDAIERASVLDRVSSVRVAVLEGGNVEITAGNDEVGRIEERIGCESDWTGTIDFLLSHLRDAIRAATDDYVLLCPSTALKPVLIPSTGLEQSILPRRPD
jgi:DNA polymerase III sliding clamp (beta) subunit (PCNA family)